MKHLGRQIISYEFYCLDGAKKKRKWAFCSTNKLNMYVIDTIKGINELRTSYIFILFTENTNLELLS